MRIRQLGLGISVRLAEIARNAKEGFREFIKNEDGDTNFISILVLLGIGLALAAVFFIFRDQIVTWVREVWDQFFGSKDIK